MGVKQKIEQILRDETSAASAVRFLLFMMSLLYRGAVTLRNSAYQLGLLPRKHLPAVVVSVGNIAACGTGKTPCTQLLARLLSEHLPVAILTRGFKSTTECSGQNKKIDLMQLPDPIHVGDEPLLLAKSTGVPVWVGKKRFVSGMAAIQEGARCLILDDGLQHRQLERDIEIILVDAKDPLCQQRFLPYGWLRDSIDRFKQATVIIATGLEQDEDYPRLNHFLGDLSKAPVIAMRTEVINPDLPEGRVGLFCGIGRPERFVKTVRDLNQEIVDTLICPDHELPSQAALHRFASRCREQGASVLVCTEKDAIKIPSSWQLPLPLHVVQVRQRVVAGQVHWEQLIETIRKKVMTL